jgi:hypothetical protein
LQELNRTCTGVFRATATVDGCTANRKTPISKGFPDQSGKLQAKKNPDEQGIWCPRMEPTGIDL